MAVNPKEKSRLDEPENSQQLDVDIFDYTNVSKQRKKVMRLPENIDK